MGKEKGIALVMATFTVALIAAFMASFITVVNSRGVLIETYESVAQARYAAESGLEEVKNYIRTSAYNAGGNVWLDSHSSPVGFLAIDNLMIDNITVDVTITGLANGWHRVVATAQAPTLNSSALFEVRGRDSFSRYMFFTDQDDINIGATAVHGDVHSNRGINFAYGGAKMYDDVTAVQGIGFNSGATSGNTTFYGEVNGYAAAIPWPNTTEISALDSEAQGVYQVSNSSAEYSSFGIFNTEIEFSGNTVTITAKNKTTGAVLKTGNYPLPVNNLIFVQNDVTSIKGDISGRVTVATLGKIDVTGKIRYQDNEGDRAYLLKRYGVIVDPDSTGTLAWTEANGFTYEPNPDYNPTVPAGIGLMAKNDITITSAASYNMEFHASTFSSLGNWHCDLTQNKGNLRVLGSMTQKTKGWRYNASDDGWAKSGEYIYDSNLLAYPPAHYLQVSAPLFGAWCRN